MKVITDSQLSLNMPFISLEAFLQLPFHHSSTKPRYYGNGKAEG